MNEDNQLGYGITKRLIAPNLRIVWLYKLDFNMPLLNSAIIFGKSQIQYRVSLHPVNSALQPGSNLSRN